MRGAADDHDDLEFNRQCVRVATVIAAAFGVGQTALAIEAVGRLLR